MKSIFIFLFVCLSISCFSANLKITLTGKVTDKATGLNLPGVSIYIPDLKTGAVTNRNGIYSLENLPAKIVLIQISYTGYQTIIEHVDLSQINTRDFVLQNAVKEFHDVVITGMSKATERNRTPTSIVSVSHISLLQNAGTNIIDALSTQAGVSQLSTGAGISKPVIRGLGYNRVVVVNDGVRQEGQQWGDEHGIEIDEHSVYKAEILKGPASLTFGSDAMAGVINLISFPTLPAGKISGSIIANYQTNNGLFAVSGNMAGNKKGFIWDARYSNKRAHAYQNKYDGYVYNSGFREDNVAATIGVNKSWGFSHLTLSTYHLQPGIIEGSRDSSTGKFVKPVAINDTVSNDEIATDSDFKNYAPGIPYQQIHHYKAVYNHNLYIHNGSLKFSAAYQQNSRQEYGDVLKPKDFGLYFLLNTFNYDIRYILPEVKNWNLSAGLNGMYQNSKNKGIEFLVPEYSLFDIGGFIITKKTINRFDISGGFRYDIRMEKAKKLWLDTAGKQTEMDTAGVSKRFQEFNSNFKGISGSLGFAYRLSKKSFMKLNVSRGFRAPNIAELGSNGEHEGTSRYEKGNTQLLPENSWEIDGTFGVNSEHVSLEMDLFDNHIGHFIYQQKLNSMAGGDSLTAGLQTFRFVQGNANLWGGELMIDIHPHPLDWLHFENSFSYVRSMQTGEPDSLQNLPLTPAPKLRTEIKIEKAALGKFFSNTYIKMEMEHFFTQNKYFKAFNTETASPGYTLLNAGLGGTIQHKKHVYVSVFISVNNIANKAYQNHLSRLKYVAVNNVTGRNGVYNMGRNVSLKVLLPF